MFYLLKKKTVNMANTICLIYLYSIICLFKKIKQLVCKIEINANNKFGSSDSKYVYLLYSHKTTIYI